MNMNLNKSNLLFDKQLLFYNLTYVYWDDDYYDIPIWNYLPVAPSGCPFDISPPLGLTTYLPP